MQLGIQTVLKMLLDDKTEREKCFVIDDAVFDKLCAICKKIEASEAFSEADGFDVEIEPETNKTIISLRFPCAIKNESRSAPIRLV